MRRNRGVLRLDLAMRTGFRWTAEVPDAAFFFFFVAGFCGEEELSEADAGAACPRKGKVGHTTIVSSNAKRKFLRDPDTSFDYRRKLLPRRETSSSARLRISS